MGPVSMPTLRHPPVKRCAFCPNKADSREHAWQDWALRRLVRPSGRLYGEINREPVAVDPLQKAIRLKCVCRDCNGGWMKDIEDAALPALSMMMRDISIPLDADQQSQIARWGVLRAMVWEFVARAGRPLFYLDEQRQALRIAGVVPQFTSVWVARYSGRATLFTQGTDIRDAVSQTGPVDVRGYVTTLAYGYLAMQVLSMWLQGHTGKNIEAHPKPGPWVNATGRMWPVAHTRSWPPPVSIGTPAVSFKDFVTRWTMGAEDVSDSLLDDL